MHAGGLAKGWELSMFRDTLTGRTVTSHFISDSRALRALNQKSFFPQVSHETKSLRNLIGDIESSHWMSWHFLYLRVEHQMVSMTRCGDLNFVLSVIRTFTTSLSLNLSETSEVSPHQVSMIHEAIQLNSFQETSAWPAPAQITSNEMLKNSQLTACRLALLWKHFLHVLSPLRDVWCFFVLKTNKTNALRSTRVSFKTIFIEHEPECFFFWMMNPDYVLWDSQQW